MRVCWLVTVKIITYIQYLHRSC